MVSAADTLRKLYMKEPRPGLINWEVIDCNNSTYTNNSMSVYYSFGCGFSEMIAHCYWVYSCKDSIDLSYCYSCELCYECTDCFRCYNCNYSSHCENCSYLEHCHFLLNCSYCFGCSGLYNKTYCIFNTQYTREEYEKELLKVKKMSHEGILKKVAALKYKVPMPAIIMRDSTNVTGNHIDQGHNLLHCFDCYRSNDSIYCFNGYENIGCVDCSFTKSTNCYETVGGGMNYNCMFCLFCESCQDVMFSYNCRDCRNCFGCVNISHKTFHIFNEPYSEEAYNEKVKELTKELKNAGMYGLQVFL